jgi:ribosomal protein S18 acetylase RimI-like enzyme
MDQGTLLLRLWDGFARLQLLLGGHAGQGYTLERDGLVASVVATAPDSPTLNAAVAMDPEAALEHLDELAARYGKANIRRWGVWIDGQADSVAQTLAENRMVMTNASPGMGASLEDVETDGDENLGADLATVGRVNDLAYGNFDGRLERTLTPLPNGVLKGYRVDLNGSPAAVALALHHSEDAGISFVATVPNARRQGLATQVMRQALKDAQDNGCTTTTLQATDMGERLYEYLGYRRLTAMELWERRP